MIGGFYVNSFKDFLSDSTEKIIGKLTYEAGIAGYNSQLHKQTLSWAEEIEILKNAFTSLSDEQLLRFSIILEYPIARREKRIDIVLLINSIIIIIEFKGGRLRHDKNGEDQLIDYCLDLRDFHFESRNRDIVPVLLTSDNSTKEHTYPNPSNNIIHPIIHLNKHNLARYICGISSDNCLNAINLNEWNRSRYSPTPTIIEAAKTLFAGKSVKEISRSHAGTKNLTRTTNAVIEAINLAKERNEKIICFITGVPGAGKTLAGLNIAHHSEYQRDEESLVTFLSGNGPLIKVLREALTRDAMKRLKPQNSDLRKKEQERIIAFIENVHRFIDAYFVDTTAIPNNRIIIFDEAQRAWNAEHSNRKFKRDFSEPEMIFNIMDRHQGWAVIIALIGGGQEINTGEAGLREWGNNISLKYPNWKVYISPELKIGDHSTGNLTLFNSIPKNITVVENPDLHLEVSIRSYKAEQLSRWVNLVLTNKPIDAKQVLESSLQDYPIRITRNLSLAKKWLNMSCTGTRRMGLVASSGARRLRPYGLDVKSELDEANWFLNPKSDVRSSYYLEVPATEFGVQGLELDWTGVCWDGDLRRTENNKDWDFKSFKGTTWRKVNNLDTKQYVLNKYRVLMTRAREGMIIWIPEGDNNDYTRTSIIYDPIYDYLKSCGISDIE